MEEYEQIIIDMLNCFDNVNNQYNYYHKKKDEFEGFHNDVRHIYELGSIDAIDMMQLASEYRRALKERRLILDNCSYLCRIHGLFDKYSGFFEELEYVLGKMRIEQNKKNNRQYNAKSKIGQELIDKYGKDGDGLVKSYDHDKLEDLKDLLETKNCM